MTIFDDNRMNDGLFQPEGETAPRPVLDRWEPEAPDDSHRLRPAFGKWSLIATLAILLFFGFLSVNGGPRRVDSGASLSLILSGEHTIRLHTGDPIFLGNTQIGSVGEVLPSARQALVQVDESYAGQLSTADDFIIRLPHGQSPGRYVEIVRSDRDSAIRLRDNAVIRVVDEHANVSVPHLASEFPNWRRIIGCVAVLAVLVWLLRFQRWVFRAAIIVLFVMTALAALGSIAQSDFPVVEQVDELLRSCLR